MHTYSSSDNKGDISCSTFLRPSQATCRCNVTKRLTPLLPIPETSHSNLYADIIILPKVFRGFPQLPYYTVSAIKRTSLSKPQIRRKNINHFRIIKLAAIRILNPILLGAKDRLTTNNHNCHARTQK